MSRQGSTKIWTFMMSAYFYCEDHGQFGHRGKMNCFIKNHFSNLQQRADILCIVLHQLNFFLRFGYGILRHGGTVMVINIYGLNNQSFSSLYEISLQAVFIGIMKKHSFTIINWCIHDTEGRYSDASAWQFLSYSKNLSFLTCSQSFFSYIYIWFVIFGWPLGFFIFCLSKWFCAIKMLSNI